MLVEIYRRGRGGHASGGVRQLGRCLEASKEVRHDLQLRATNLSCGGGGAVMLVVVVRICCKCWWCAFG